LAQHRNEIDSHINRVKAKVSAVTSELDTATTTGATIH
jgi:hypothetical protein